MSSLSKAIQDSLLKLGSPSPLTDGDLLTRFVAQHEEAAFHELVRRHGPMVLRVCQRQLHHAQDAEDAFQATFIVLARKARSIAKLESVGSWLHGVALRVAGHARAKASRRHVREQQVDAVAPNGGRPGQSPSETRDLQSVVDAEVNRLPEKYRTAVVLHYLEGKTCEEAALLLRCEVSAVKKRLERARERLRGRLERQGVMLSAAALSTLAARETASAAPLTATVRTAAGSTSATPVRVLALADAAMKTTPRRLAVLVVAVVCLTLGIGGYLLASKKPTLSPDRPLTATGDWKSRGTLVGHFGPITAAAFSPDGMLLATASTDKTVQLWDMARQSPGRTMRGHEKAVGALVFSPNGQALATTGWDNTVRLWEVATGRQKSCQTFTESYAFLLAYNPDGKSVGRITWVGAMSFKDPLTGREVQNPKQYEINSGNLNCIALSPDRKFLAMALSRSVTLRDQSTNTDRRLRLRVGTDSSNDYRAVAFSPDGRLLAAGNLEGTIQLWDLATDQNIRKLQRTRLTAPEKNMQTMAIHSLQFSPRGGIVAAGMSDGTVTLWDVATGREQASLRQNDLVNSLAFSPDGQVLVSGDGMSVRLWQRQGAVESNTPDRR